MRIKDRFDATGEGISYGIEMIRTTLKKYGVKRSTLNKAVLVAEESLAGLVAHAGQDGKITLSIRAFLGTVTMEMECRGAEFQYVQSLSRISFDGDDTDDIAGEEAMEQLQSIIVRSFAEEVKYRHHDGINRVKIVAVRSRQSFLFQTIGAILLAIVLGIILTSLPFDGFNSGLNTYLLDPAKTMYLRAIKLIVAPVVFFSIVSCIVRFSNLSELGRIGGRVLLTYLLTTVIAVAVGFGVYYLFQPGNPQSALGTMADSSAIASKEVNISIIDTIVDIIPSNYLQPFLDSNMLQLIFLAAITGIATGLIGKYSTMVKDLFEACNELFLRITAMIIKFMPLAVFCSFLSMMLTTGTGMILSTLGMFGTFLVGLILMMLIYCILILAVGRISPGPFLKKYTPTMLQVFSMASSNAAIPINMDACQRLGISKKVYSLSIPLGATLNMDGTCIYLAVFALALAKIFGIQITGATIFGMVFSIIVLSMGSPGASGAGLICLSVLLQQIGVPEKAIGIVMGIDTLIVMFRSMSNCVGDVAVSLLVAKKENALDLETYRKKA